MKSLFLIVSVMVLISMATAQQEVKMIFDQNKPGCEHAIIHGATYGLNDITNKVAHEYNAGTRSFAASSAKWGATADLTQHTLTVVYQKCGNLAIQTALEGETVVLP